MLCRKFWIKSSRGSVPVHLNVYDLTPMNGYAYWFGLGVYHSGVQVHGVEYAFGAHEHPTTGIFGGEPKTYEGFTFRKSVLVGWTSKTPEELKGVMDELAEQYKGNAYNLISKNCNHFCNDACYRLTGHHIPHWVNRLARIGLFCKCMIPDNIKQTKINNLKVEDKLCEGHEGKISLKKVRSVSLKLSPSSASPLSSISYSPPHLPLSNGQSNTTSSPPSSSPL